MKRILCPTDFSDTAHNAVAYSGKLAKKIGATLTLFNVQSLANLSLEDAVMGEVANAAVARTRLERQCDEVRKVFRISCNAEVATSLGSVISLIGSKSSVYDLLVMGSSGPGNLSHMLLGSNTYQVIRSSSIPLLLIPGGCEYSEVKTIVYAFDYWHTDELPLMQLIASAKTLGADLRVLQVTEEPYSRDTEAEILDKQECFLDLYKDEIPISFKTIYAGNIAEGLDGYMLRSKSDMLALYAEHQGFLKKLFHKSLIKELSAKATYPLFIFHS